MMRDAARTPTGLGPARLRAVAGCGLPGSFGLLETTAVLNRASR